MMDNSLTTSINISIISNINIEPYFVPLMKSCFDDTTHIINIPFVEHHDVECRKKLVDSDIIVVWLNLESLFADAWNIIYSNIKSQHQVIAEILGLCKKLDSDLTYYSNAKIIWFSFEGYFFNLPVVVGHNYDLFINELNMKLYNLVGDHIFFVNLEQLIATIGTVNAYDPKGKYRWNNPYSKAVIELVVKEIHKQYLVEKGITKKCLILDCDNVLWGGIISEDGIENIKLGGSGLGRAYQDFQRFVLSLYYHGVILAICSKNDLDDIMIMFREHNEMVLKEEHIAYFQVHWDNKPDSIKMIAETLNIGFDSMVFIDDSPVEIDAVKTMLPAITAIQFERNTLYGFLSCFNLKSNASIGDIIMRNETYRTNQSRNGLLSQYSNYSEFIEALAVKMDIHEMLPIELNRISELTQRTNKCTNGKRYTVAEIKERIKFDKVSIYTLSLSDRFSDLGLVGAFEVKENTLVMFSLSCRALGKGVEEKMLDFIADKYEIRKLEFYSTGKNEAIKTLLLKTFSNVTLT